MYSNDVAIAKYVMNAVEEGVGVEEIREEVSQLGHTAPEADATIAEYGFCKVGLFGGGGYETL